MLTDEQIADARRGKTAKIGLRAICEAQDAQSRLEEWEANNELVATRGHDFITLAISPDTWDMLGEQLKKAVKKLGLE